MDSTWLCSFLLTIITGPVFLFPSHTLALVPVTEESYKQAVLPPFLDGLNSLKSVAEALQSSTDLMQGIPNNVGQLLELSLKQLSEAEISSKAQVSALNANVEESLSKIKKMNDDQKVQEAQQQGLNVQLSGLQKQESLTRQQLQAAQQAVNNANDALKRAYQAKQNAEHDRDVGIGLCFLPLIGSIIGATMITDANAAIGNAENAIAEATRSLNTQKNAVNMYTSQCQSCRQTISSIEQTIAANRAQIQAIQEDISRESALQQKLSNFLIPVRKCTTLLSTLTGRTRTANILLEFSEMVDALLPVLEEIVEIVRPLIGKSSEYQLLITARLPTIIEKLEEANSRVKAATASKNSAVYAFL